MHFRCICSGHCLLFDIMRLRHCSEHLRGPFSLMPLMQVFPMRSLHGAMLPERHAHLMILADVPMLHASASCARHAALSALSCLGSFILAFLMLGTAPPRFYDIHLGTHVSVASHQGAALSDHHAAVTCGTFSAMATDDLL